MYIWIIGGHVRKVKSYRCTKFDSQTIYAADKAFRAISTTKTSYVSLDVELGDERWSFDTLEEFLAAADRGTSEFCTRSYDSKFSLMVTFYPGSRSSGVMATARTRGEVESLFAVFENNAERCRLPESADDGSATEGLKIFIGHGQDPQWRDLKDHLHEKHGYLVEAFEVGSRAGHSIRDILEEMLEDSSFALFVMTGEDQGRDGTTRAKQNVVHEAGLFQGKLGFGRAIILLEDGTDEFSNIHGLQQIRFSKGKIKESFGDVLAALKRELG
jgi:predicted nucleotide-binding protein